MNKSEYLKLDKEISDRIKSLGEKRQELKQKYLDANLKLPIGSKVEIIIPKRKIWDTVYPARTELGFISGKSVSYNGIVEYKLSKCKKDGSQSSHKLWETSDDSNTKLIE